MKLGLALSGGGIRGIAHAGVLKALEDNNIKIDVIGGTSAGGIIAALYAMGYSPYYIYVLFKRYAKKITGNKIETIFNQIAENKGIKKIKDIKMPIAIPTVDISDTNKYIFTNKIPKKNNDNYIEDISIGKAIRATSCFPGVFSPVTYKGHMFLDGGILDNVPVEEVKKQGANKVIAVNFAADKIDEKSKMMDIIMRTIDCMGNKISENNIKSSDFLLTVPTDKTGLLDVRKLDSCYEYGYKAVVDNLSEIKNILH
ncbi:MAG: patatin-like phospholipase family protein [Clostridia bacterium]|nr:patatin-like phospholipase family protein [Clostridia bacterium]